MDKKKLLLIDDEKDNLRLLEVILNNEGFAVHAFSSGCDGLEAYIKAKGNFDAVILDLMMPAVSGWDFIRIVDSLIEANVFPPREHVIVVSAIDSYSKLSLLAGAKCVDQVHRKPLDMEEFLPKLHRLVS